MRACKNKIGMGLILKGYRGWYSISPIQESKKLPYSTSARLWISRETADAKERTAPPVRDPVIFQVEIDAFLGIVKYIESAYVVVVTDSELVVELDEEVEPDGTCKQNRIFLIKAARCIPLEPDSQGMPKNGSWNGVSPVSDNPHYKTAHALNSATQWLRSLLGNEEAVEFINPDSRASGIEAVEQALTMGYYYSDNIDLTRSLERQIPHLHVPTAHPVNSSSEANSSAGQSKHCSFDDLVSVDYNSQGGVVENGSHLVTKLHTVLNEAQLMVTHSDAVSSANGDPFSDLVSNAGDDIEATLQSATNTSPVCSSNSDSNVATIASSLVQDTSALASAFEKIRTSYGNVFSPCAVDSSFNWCAPMSLGLPAAWCTPIIQGYVGYACCAHENKVVEILLIGRRSNKRYGTRLNARGIDSDGNVGNFCESELRLRIDRGPWKSFTQLRGSVPIFWCQDSMSSPPFLTKKTEDTFDAFKNHWLILTQFGSRFYFLNLLDVKESERLLTEALEKQIANFPDLHLELVNYNFNEHVKWENFTNLATGFVEERLGSTLDEIGYFDSDKSGGSCQKGVIRTNCLDCLDRTNAMQFTIACACVVRILQKQGIEPWADDYDEYDLYKELKSLWCAHGDAISLHYAGTPSIFTGHIKQGKSTMSGYLHMGKIFAQRMYSCLISDGLRQEAFDIILRRVARIERAPYVHTGEALKQLKVWCGTWNLGGCEINDVDLDEWVDTGTTEADIYAFYVQELVDLTALRVVMNINDESRQYNFNSHVSAILSNISNRIHVEYRYVCSTSMIGLYLVIYAREHLIPHIRHVSTSSVKTGLGGNTGNKGAVGIKFDLQGRTLCFLNVHLSTGKSPTPSRFDQLSYILRQSFADKQGVGSSDLLLIAGDFNFHVLLDSQEIWRLLRKNDLASLLTRDEYNLAKASKLLCVQGLREAPIKFLPTYKYVKGSRFYNVKRNPAWCDRVFWGVGTGTKGPAVVEAQLYHRLEHYYTSDHKPVALVASAKFTDVEKEEKQNAQCDLL